MTEGQQHGKSQYSVVDGNIPFFPRYFGGATNTGVCLGPLELVQENLSSSIPGIARWEVYCYHQPKEGLQEYWGKIPVGFSKHFLEKASPLGGGAEAGRGISRMNREMCRSGIPVQISYRTFQQIPTDILQKRKKKRILGGPKPLLGRGSWDVPQPLTCSQNSLSWSSKM